MSILLNIDERSRSASVPADHRPPSPGWWIQGPSVPANGCRPRGPWPTDLASTDPPLYRAYQELWALGYLESRPGSYSTVRKRAVIGFRWDPDRTEPHALGRPGKPRC